MYSFTGTALVTAFGSLVLLFLLALALSFRDTCRGFGETFDLRVVRNFGRSLPRLRPQFSLALLIASAVILPALTPLLLVFEWPGFVWFAIGTGYALLVIAPLVYWFFVGAFGPGPREHWRNVLDRHDPWQQPKIGPRPDSTSMRNTRRWRTIEDGHHR